MKQTCYDYWLTAWTNSTTSDEQTTRALLEQYAHKTRGIASCCVRPTDVFTGLFRQRTRIGEVETVLALCFSLPYQASVELMIAHLKHEINRDPGYVWGDLSADWALRPKRLSTSSNEFLLRFSCGNILYVVNDPDGQFQSNLIPMDTLNIPRHVSSIDELRPYSTALFMETSRRKHTRGGFIDERDDLIELLAVIQLKTGVNYTALNPNAVILRYQKLGDLKPMDEVCDWKKQGLFTIPGHTSRAHHYQAFVNTTASKRLSLIELRVHDHGHISLALTMEEPHLRTQLHADILAAGLTINPCMEHCEYSKREMYWGWSDAPWDVDVLHVPSLSAHHVLNNLMWVLLRFDPSATPVLSYLIELTEAVRIARETYLSEQVLHRHVTFFRQPSSVVQEAGDLRGEHRAFQLHYPVK